MPTLLPTGAVFTGDRPTDVGTLTHVLIATHAPLIQGGEVPGDLLQRMYAVAYGLIEANPNKTRVLATEAASYAHRYLTSYAPCSDWRLLGAEYDTGDGNADVAWQHSVSGVVFYDEVKTSRITNGRKIRTAWFDQCRRYAIAGVQRWGDRFAGVRLLPLMAHGTARLITGDATATLALSKAEPLGEGVTA